MRNLANHSEPFQETPFPIVLSYVIHRGANASSSTRNFITYLQSHTDNRNLYILYYVTTITEGGTVS